MVNEKSVALPDAPGPVQGGQPHPKKKRIAIAFIAVYMSIALFYGARYAVYWTTQEMSPLQHRMNEMVRRLPPDARVLALAPDPEAMDRRFYTLAARCIPRPIYTLPPKYPTIESARDWIREKNISWVVTIGTESDPGVFEIRKLDDDR